MSKKTRTPFVYIVNDYGMEYQRMFYEMGWENTSDFNKADLIQFTGGADVSPYLYGQHVYHKTVTNPKRDKVEKMIFVTALRKKKAMSGICRGGQFLNVMCGGNMWQDVDGHVGEHLATDVESKEEYIVTSTHHQMMMPASGTISPRKILLIAQEASEKIKCCSNLMTVSNTIRIVGSYKDTEAIYYSTHNVLCFQPHPEFPNQLDLRDLYFSYIYDNLNF